MESSNGLGNEMEYEELNNPFECEEIRKAINELKSGKAAGHDLLINELYIHACESMAPMLTCLFNNVFSSGLFPRQWVDGIIIPLHKKGCTSHVDNYRGITLLSTLGKLFTRVLNNRLSFWSETYNIISDVQGGFRKGRSTVDNIFILHSLINLFVNKGRRLYCTFIDFRKAFDYVSRDCLWYKLLSCGIRGNMYNVMHDMYREVKSVVKVIGNLSDSFQCYVGVRQGESLSPFLFSLFINDIEQEFTSKGADAVCVADIQLFLLLYADDAVILSESREGLQEGLDIMHDYCVRWRLTVNTEKTKVVVFRKGGQYCCPQLTIGFMERNS